MGAPFHRSPFTRIGFTCALKRSKCLQVPVLEYCHPLHVQNTAWLLPIRISYPSPPESESALASTTKFFCWAAANTARTRAVVSSLRWSCASPRRGPITAVGTWARFFFNHISVSSAAGGHREVGEVVAHVAFFELGQLQGDGLLWR